MALDGLRRTVRNISSIYERRRVALYALSLETAARALNEFRALQAQNFFWTNQTGEAMRRVFTRAFRRDDAIGWIMAHGVEYGVYLELANDGRHQAIRVIVRKYADQFFREARRIYGDAA